uniref:Prostate and testis expressed 1 n=1 Tax=Chinchilla lanigera TaxID=34839 RepID=A0A8C2WDI5_CHILA
MGKSLLLGPLILFCCFKVLSGSLREKANIDDEMVFSEDNSGEKVVQCRMCHLQFPGEKCTRGRGRCMATPEEACTVGKIFTRDGSLWLTFMGCLKNCANVRNIPWSIYLVSFKCCRGYNLCNENL